MRHIIAQTNEFQDLLDQYYYNKQNLEIFEAREEELKNKIKSLVGNVDFSSIPDTEKKVLELVSNLDDKVKITEVTTNRFDSASFEKAHPELYKEFTKQTKTNRMTFAFNKAYTLTDRSELAKRRQNDVSTPVNADINASVDSKSNTNDDVTEI